MEKFITDIILQLSNERIQLIKFPLLRLTGFLNSNYTDILLVSSFNLSSARVCSLSATSVNLAKCFCARTCLLCTFPIKILP